MIQKKKDSKLETPLLDYAMSVEESVICYL